MNILWLCLYHERTPLLERHNWSGRWPNVLKEDDFDGQLILYVHWISDFILS